MAAPTLLWRDAAAGAVSWQIDVSFADGSAAIHVAAKGERMHIGEIDPRCVSATNQPPGLTPQQAAARTWMPDPATWAAIKKHSVAGAATVTISGFAAGNARQPVSRGHMPLHTSGDPVGAPIFYRDVPLMPSKTEKGVIKPLDTRAVPLIAWRLRDVSRTRSRVLLEDMHTCANCHSFSSDGKTLGMDLDGPANDKSLYTLVPVHQKMTIRMRTYARNSDWLDDRSLWTSAVNVCPGSAKAHINLGSALSKLPGRLPEAIAEYEVALRIEPGNAVVHMNLGNALSELPGRLAEAIAEYEAALRIDPDYAEAHFNLGNALSRLPGRLADAISEYEAALRIRPDPKLRQMVNRLRAGQK
jgi:hypothetical protein